MRIKSLDELFELSLNKNLKAEIETDTRAINPFTTLKVKIRDGVKELISFETVFKCDIYQGCRFCFTEDLTKLYVEKGRNKIYMPIVWKGCYTFMGAPVLEENFFERGMLAEKLYLFKEGHVLILEIGNGISLREDKATGIVEVSQIGKRYYCLEVEVLIGWKRSS